MKGHVARKRDRYYSVIYEGLDPVTGKERRTWHPAGTDRAEAEALVARLAAERDGRNDEVRALTLVPTSPTGGCPPSASNCAPAPIAATSTRPSATSCLPSGGSGSGGCAPRTSNGSTNRCCAPPTGPGRSRPRPSTRCT